MLNNVCVGFKSDVIIYNVKMFLISCENTKVSKYYDRKGQTDSYKRNHKTEETVKEKNYIKKYLLKTFTINMCYYVYYV